MVLAQRGEIKKDARWHPFLVFVLWGDGLVLVDCAIREFDLEACWWFCKLGIG